MAEAERLCHDTGPAAARWALLPVLADAASPPPRRPVSTRPSLLPASQLHIKIAFCKQTVNGGRGRWEGVADVIAVSKLAIERTRLLLRSQGWCSVAAAGIKQYNYH